MLTVCWTSDPDFRLFEVPAFRSGDRTCVGVLDSSKSGFLYAKVLSSGGPEVVYLGPI